jgi:hypothetical protein
MGYCRDCRFYAGRNCAVKDAVMQPGNSCATFVDATERPDDEFCKTCRFYSGQECEDKNSQRAPMNTCANWSAFR